MTNTKNGFLAQTAEDYALSYEVVESIYKKFPDKFYDKLEEHLKHLREQNENPKK